LELRCLPLFPPFQNDRGRAEERLNSDRVKNRSQTAEQWVHTKDRLAKLCEANVMNRGKDGVVKGRNSQALPTKRKKPSRECFTCWPRSFTNEVGQRAAIWGLWDSPLFLGQNRAYSSEQGKTKVEHGNWGRVPPKCLRKKKTKLPE